jgi:hypothetical protein
MFRQSSVWTSPAQTRFTLTGASSMASARVTASRAPQIPAAMTHPFRGRKPMIPLVRMIDPVVLIRLAAYFAAPTAPQKRVSKNQRAFSKSTVANSPRSNDSPAVTAR